jgi:hypothetical protein
MLSTEAVFLLEQQGVSRICFAALPPGDSAPTRYLCRPLRTRSPECEIMLGGWECVGYIEEDRAFLLAAGANTDGRTVVFCSRAS